MNVFLLLVPRELFSTHAELSLDNDVDAVGGVSLLVQDPVLGAGHGMQILGEFAQVGAGQLREERNVFDERNLVTTLVELGR